jgi:hypothetical protein
MKIFAYNWIHVVTVTHHYFVDLKIQTKPLKTHPRNPNPENKQFCHAWIVTLVSQSQVSCCSFLLLLRPELILAVLSQWSFALSWLDLLWQVRPRCNQQVWMIFWRFRIFLSGVLNCWLVSRLQGRRAKFGTVTTGCLYVIPVSSSKVVTIDFEMDCSVSSNENRCKSFTCFHRNSASWYDHCDFQAEELKRPTSQSAGEITSSSVIRK